MIEIISCKWVYNKLSKIKLSWKNNLMYIVIGLMIFLGS